MAHAICTIKEVKLEYLMFKMFHLELESTFKPSSSSCKITTSHETEYVKRIYVLLQCYTIHITVPFTLHQNTGCYNRVCLRNENICFFTAIHREIILSTASMKMHVNKKM